MLSVGIFIEKNNFHGDTIESNKDSRINNQGGSTTGHHADIVYARSKTHKIFHAWYDTIKIHL